MRTRASTRTAAIGACHRSAQRDRHIGAKHRLLKLQIGNNLEVLPTRRARGSTATTTKGGTAATKECIEEIAKTTAAKPLTRTGAAAGLAKAVVASAAIGIAERFVGPSNLFEQRLRFGVVGARIGMQLACLLAIGLLQVFGRGVARDAK